VTFEEARAQFPVLERLAFGRVKEHIAHRDFDEAA